MAVAAALAAVAGCRAEEQRRPLSYDKGTYGGVQDTPLSPATRHALAERAINQIGLDHGARAAVAPSTTGSSVRPPAPPSG